MIIRPRPALHEVLFAVRGSIVPRIAGRLLFMALISIAAVVLADRQPHLLSGLAAMPFTLVGLSLSIFMSFRNTACYDRWWEGRKLWGQLLIASRSLARQVARLDQVDREPLLLGLCAFASGLSARLRDGDEHDAIRRWMPGGVSPTSPNPTDAVLCDIGARCLALVAAGRIEAIHYSVLEVQLTELAHVQGGCERIKGTPVPFSYSLLLHRTAYLFCMLLPFALAPTLGWWSPLPTLLVSYAFFGLDALGDELGDPFGDDPNDLPLDALVRTLEREMLAATGHVELPPPLTATDYRLV
jgi:putative membrane protein